MGSDRTIYSLRDGKAAGDLVRVGRAQVPL